MPRPSKILARLAPGPEGTPQLTIQVTNGLFFSIINRSPSDGQKSGFRPRRPLKYAGSGAGSSGFRREAILGNSCFVKGFLHFYAGFRRGFRRVLAGSATALPQKVAVSLEASSKLRPGSARVRAGSSRPTARWQPTRRVAGTSAPVSSTGFSNRSRQAPLRLQPARLNLNFKVRLQDVSDKLKSMAYVVPCQGDSRRLPVQGVAAATAALLPGCTQKP